MTNERPESGPRDADELTRQVAELGDTDEDRLETVADRNASLEERLPGGEELPRTGGQAGEESTTEEQAGGPQTVDEPPIDE